MSAADTEVADAAMRNGMIKCNVLFVSAMKMPAGDFSRAGSGLRARSGSGARLPPHGAFSPVPVGAIPLLLSSSWATRLIRMTVK
jgi:hypothetical protein